MFELFKIPCCILGKALDFSVPHMKYNSTSCQVALVNCTVLPKFHPSKLLGCLLHSATTWPGQVPSHSSFSVPYPQSTAETPTNSCMSTFVLVAQSCPTLCDSMDCSLPGSSVHGILQARILE